MNCQSTPSGGTTPYEIELNMLKIRQKRNCATVFSDSSNKPTGGVPSTGGVSWFNYDTAKNPKVAIFSPCTPGPNGCNPATVPPPDYLYPRTSATDTATTPFTIFKYHDYNNECPTAPDINSCRLTVQNAGSCNDPTAAEFLPSQKISPTGSFTTQSRFEYKISGSNVNDLMIEFKTDVKAGYQS